MIKELAGFFQFPGRAKFGMENANKKGLCTHSTFSHLGSDEINTSNREEGRIRIAIELF